MSNLPGNPHVYAGPQIAHPDWINEIFIAEQGETVETVFLSELARNTEANLALAYEQRTATLVHALLSDSLVTDGKYDEIQAEVRKRLGLGDNND